MQFQGFSTNAIRMLHAAVADALAKDDRSDREGRPREFCVRETPDWKVWSDNLEGILSAREVEFTPIDWSVTS